MDKIYNEPRNGRCKNHGGMSLGRSQPLRRAQAAAKRAEKNRIYWAKRHAKWDAQRAAESLARKKATAARRNKRKRDIRAMKKAIAEMPDGVINEDGVMEY